MNDPLALDPEMMRATGYRMVDLLVDQVAGIPRPDEPAGSTRRSGGRRAERLAMS